MPESRAKRYIGQLLSGLDFMHLSGCTHNDLKPSNVLLSAQDEAVLCDFGFAQRYDLEPIEENADGAAQGKRPFISKLSWGAELELLAPASPAHLSFSGTPEYLSPERVKAKPHDERLSDLWSLGVTAYEVSEAQDAPKKISQLVS